MAAIKNKGIRAKIKNPLQICSEGENKFNPGIL